MKKAAILILFHLTGLPFLFGQQAPTLNDKQQKAITFLIKQYAQAREKKDTDLLKAILTFDVDQLVSTGEWRVGLKAAVEGMMKALPPVPEQGPYALKKYKWSLLHLPLWIAGMRYRMQLVSYGKCGAHLSLLLIRKHGGSGL